MRITAPPSSFTALTDGTAPPSPLPSPSSFLIPTTAPSLVSKYLSLKIGSGLPLLLLPLPSSSSSSPRPPSFPFYFCLLRPPHKYSLLLLPPFAIYSFFFLVSLLCSLLPPLPLPL